VKSFNVREAPGLIGTIVGVVAFVLVFLLLGPLDTFLARQSLSFESDLMLRAFHDAMDSARAELAGLPSIDALNCVDGMSTVLGSHNFNNSYLRLLAVARDGVIICRGTRIPVSLSEKRQVLRLDDEWSFLKVDSPGMTHSVLLVQKRGDLQFLGLFEPLIFDFLSAADCRGCVYYHLVLGQNAEVTINSTAKPAPSAVSYTVDRVQRYGRLRLTLNGTKEYVDDFRAYGRLLSAAIALLIASAIGTMVYGFLMRRASLTFLVKQGLRRGEFVPYYQPIIDSRDGAVLGLEALARWRMHDGRLVPPGEFIPMAEENGLIEPITDQLLKHVLVDLKRFGWCNTNRHISINAVAQQITDSPFCDKLLGLVSDGTLCDKNLTVEITERHQFSDLARGRAALSRLSEAGIGIELDDAGTGFGGFLYVQELPIHTLKIDKMFIDTLLVEGDAKKQVLDAIIEFARTSGLKTVAEGVETEEQVEHLKRRGVFAIQGYVYARPMPAEEFLRWSAKQKAESPGEGYLQSRT
jgi:EAL domain-containing protein (putative c-di-GMP-specific phosphodiesterase class I)